MGGSTRWTIKHVRWESRNEIIYHHLCVCVFFVSRFAVCLSQYILLLKSFTFSEITTMQVLSVEEWLKAIAIYFYEKKMEYFMTWSFGVFGKWRDQSAQLRSNLLSYIKLKFFYIVFFSQLCMCIWSFVQVLNLALMHDYISTRTCELSWSQFICCH